MNPVFTAPKGNLTISESSIANAGIELRRVLGTVGDELGNPDVQEIMINSGQSIFIERNGSVAKTQYKLSNEAVNAAITLIANINQDEAGYIFDGDLPGLRIAAVRSPIAINGPTMCIRKHGVTTRSIDSLRDQGVFANRLTLPIVASSRPSDKAVAKGGQGVVDFFKWMLTSRQNFIVSGGTSSGKTSFLNSLVAMLVQLDPSRRLLTIEDTRELKITLKNHVSLLAKEAAGVSIAQLVRVCLRFKPDCIWLGEGRGAELYYALKAYGTGHPGSGVSLHAESAAESLEMLEFLIRESPEGKALALDDLRKRIAKTFRILIHCRRVGKVRTLMEIVEVLGTENGQYLTHTLFIKELDYV